MEVNLALTSLLELLILFWKWGITYSHPQCLDFRPPFTIKDTSGVFCQQYAMFGCCSRQQHSAIEQKYKQLTSKVSSSCLTYLKDILCQECSPYAAHVYDAETTLVKKPLPGLCSNYCIYFHSYCSSIVPYLTNDNTVLRSLSHREIFCSHNAISDKEYCYPDILTNSGLNNALTRQAKTEEGCLCLEEFARDLRNPLIFRSPDDQSGRIFVGIQLGVVYIYYQNGTREKDIFMNLTHMVLTSSNNGDERGFLGLAFHPKFKTNGKFYVYFTLRGKDNSQRARISEFKVSSNNQNKADTKSERKILEVKQPYSNHNGGELMFGIDGYLYSFLGDGGAGGDPNNYAQNKDSLLGSVLRLDVDTNDPNISYKIPTDNPFINEVESKPEIYAYGIRNIWRCDVDEGHPITGYGKGRIICGDVGQSAYEEIDLIKKGGNYGWNSREGFECFRHEKCGKIGPEELPIHAYNHSVGNSVTGGHVYRGCLNPNLQGLYFFGDYGKGKVFRLKEKSKGSNTWDSKEIKMCGTDLCFNGLTNQYERNILSFGEDFDGEIYMLTTNWASPTAYNGKIYRIIDPRRRGDMDTCRSSKWKTQATTTTTKPTTSKTTTRLPTTTKKRTTLLPTTTRKITTKLPTTTQKRTTFAKATTRITTKKVGTTRTTSSAAPGSVPTCADIGFVIDGSGSVKQHRFTQILNYIAQLLDSIDIGPNAFQVGIVTFGNKAIIDIPLNMYHNTGDLQRAVRGNVRFKDENTNTSGGLIRLRTQLFNTRFGGRKDHPKIGILFTDGKSTYDRHKTIPEGLKLQEEGIDMYTLAFGFRNDLDMDELNAIASKPVSQHLIQLPTLTLVTEQFTKIWATLVARGDTAKGCSQQKITTVIPSTTTQQPATTSQRPTSTKKSTTTSSGTVLTTPASTTTTNGDTFEWVCDFEESSSRDQLCGIEQASNDDFDWTLTNRATPSQDTGPDRAFSGRWYMFIETSNPRRSDDKAVLLLPLFGTSGTHCFTFNTHMFGFHIRELQLQIRHNDGTYVDRWRRRGEEGNYWIQQMIQLNNLQPTDRIALIGVRGNEFSGDISIDNLHFINKPCAFF